MWSLRSGFALGWEAKPMTNNPTHGYSGLVERLQTVIDDDHNRGCQGRYIVCSCGLDAGNQLVAKDAKTAIETLTRELAEEKAIAAKAVDYHRIAMNAMDERDTLRAELTAAKERLAEAVEVIGPFAKAGRIRLCGGDDYWTGEKSIQGTDLAFHVKFMDLRNANTFLAKQENPNG
jgi:hypothetical protein